MLPEPLFAQPAMDYHASGEDGGPRLAMPPGSVAICGILLFAAASAIYFLCTNEYARKETVVGYLEATDTVKRVHAPRSGIVSELMVAAGDPVHKGQAIATFDASQPFNADDRDRMRAELQAQLVAVEDRVAENRIQAGNEAARISTGIDEIVTAIGHGRKILAIQQDKVAQLRNNRDAARPLFDSGRLSRLEWGRFKESLLNAEQQEARLRAEVDQQQANLARLQLATRELKSSQRSKALVLSQEAASIRQAIAAMTSESSYSVSAPISGRIANVYVQPGEAVSSQLAIVSITPPGAVLNARLMIPSRSIGFVAPGMHVNVLYDAFPYQQFGTFDAVLVSISAHTLLPSEVPAGVMVREPVFGAHAKLTTAWIPAYGDRVALRNGMTLKADIILERRSLFEWLIEPLLILRGRSL